MLLRELENMSSRRSGARREKSNIDTFHFGTRTRALMLLVLSCHSSEPPICLYNQSTILDIDTLVTEVLTDGIKSFPIHRATAAVISHTAVDELWTNLMKTRDLNGQT